MTEATAAGSRPACIQPNHIYCLLVLLLLCLAVRPAANHASKQKQIRYAARLAEVGGEPSHTRAYRRGFLKGVFLARALLCSASQCLHGIPCSNGFKVVGLGSSRAVLCGNERYAREGRWGVDAPRGSGAGRPGWFAVLRYRGILLLGLSLCVCGWDDTGCLPAVSAPVGILGCDLRGRERAGGLG